MRSRSLFALARLAMFLGLGLGVAAIAVIGYEAHGLRRLELGTVDTRASIRARDDPPRDVIGVTVDDETLKRLHTEFPLPRRYHALAVDRIAAARPAAIVFDIQFSNKTDARDDSALYDAIARAGNVVLAGSSNGQEIRNSSTAIMTDLFGGHRSLARAHATVAQSLLAEGVDGKVRSIPNDVTDLPSLAVASAATADGHEVAAARFDADRGLYGGGAESPSGGIALIDFRGPAGTIDTVPLWKVVAGQPSPALFRGKVVVIGATASALKLDLDTPVGTMSDLELQENAVSTALHGFPLHDSSM